MSESKLSGGEERDYQPKSRILKKEKHCYFLKKCDEANKKRSCPTAEMKLFGGR